MAEFGKGIPRIVRNHCVILHKYIRKDPLRFPRIVFIFGNAFSMIPNKDAKFELPAPDTINH